MIDEKIQAQLRSKYNPDGSPLRCYQQRMLEMLKYFDEICRKNGISYWITYGNCLGVARHGGFIPWDDDIDVEMLREDYLKLEKVFKETDKYVLQTWKNDPAYYHSYAKMRDKCSLIKETGDDNFKYRGAFIDVFVIEKSTVFCRKIYKHLRWNYMYKLAKSEKNKFLFRFAKYLYIHSIPICRLLFSCLPSSKLGPVWGVSSVDEVRELNDIFPLKRAFFDGVEVNIPNNIDNFLKKLYGDYMKLPPEDKIQKPHATHVELW